MYTNSSKNVIQLEELSLLPRTRDFFEARTSRAVPVFLGAVIVLLAAFLAWAALAQMDDVVRAQAVLRPVRDISSLRTMSGGRITAKYYSENQSVRKGDLLLSLDDEAGQTRLRNAEAQLAKARTELAETEGLYRSLEQGRDQTRRGTTAFAKAAAYFAEYRRMQDEVQQLARALQ